MKVFCMPMGAVSISPHRQKRRWFPESALPLDGMWDDARYWLPRVLAGQHVAAVITFAPDCATVAALDPPELGPVK